VRQPPVDPDLLLHLGEQAVLLPPWYWKRKGSPTAGIAASNRDSGTDISSSAGIFDFMIKPLYNNIVTGGRISN